MNPLIKLLIFIQSDLPIQFFSLVSINLSIALQEFMVLGDLIFHFSIHFDSNVPNFLYLKEIRMKGFSNLQLDQFIFYHQHLYYTLFVVQ
jgi:hypothetical protein